MQITRSWLFVPGNQPKMIDKATALDADVLIFDLEDSVPPGEKETARRLVAAALEKPRGRSLRYVRVQAKTSGGVEDDVRAAVRRGLDGLVIPKVDSPTDVQRLDASLTALESAAGVTAGTVRLLASIESARGLLVAPAIAGASQRLAGLFFGAEDFALDLGIVTLDDNDGGVDDMLYARSAIAVAAASCGLAAIDRVVTDFRSLEQLASDARRAYRLGYRGKAVIHPDQIQCVNEVFNPSADDVQWALRTIRVFEQANERGAGAVQLDGKMIDLPVVEKAKRVVRFAEALERSNGGR